MSMNDDIFRDVDRIVQELKLREKDDEPVYAFFR
jgi:hypothetical protein